MTDRPIPAKATKDRKPSPDSNPETGCDLVSPAMIEAGSRALANYDPVNWSAEENAAVISDVYRAMIRASKKS